MTKSQNTKNEQLTEQWKKGELPEGWYYVKCDDGICFDRFTYYGGFSKIFNYSVKQILAPVPSYEVYKDLIDGRKLLREYIKDTTNENAQLKELLKKANKFLKDYGFTFDGKDCAEAFKVHTKINEVLK